MRFSHRLKYWDALAYRVGDGDWLRSAFRGVVLTQALAQAVGVDASDGIVTFYGPEDLGGSEEGSRIMTVLAKYAAPCCVTSTC
jgi:hypothetical protein